MASSAAARVQERVPYRRVEKVAHAGKENAGDEQLDHQQHDAAGDGDFLISGAKLVCSALDFEEAISRIVIVIVIVSSDISPIVVGLRRR